MVKHVTRSSIQIGNDAMAMILLLYYQIINGGAFSGDETIYINHEKFNGFDFLDIEIEKSCQIDIDQSLIRQGAVIYLLCDLNDMISEYESNYLDQEISVNVINAYKSGKMSAIPEVNDLMDIVLNPNKKIDSKKYTSLLNLIYKKYVLGAIINLAEKGKMNVD